MQDQSNILDVSRFSRIFNKSPSLFQAKPIPGLVGFPGPVTTLEYQIKLFFHICNKLLINFRL